MLTELHIEGFRCFQSLTAKPLGRVNLLVGKNNSGKTAFLDAVELLVADGPGLRLASLIRRKEFIQRTVDNKQTGVSTTELSVYPLNLLFGHMFHDGLHCLIVSQNQSLFLQCLKRKAVFQGFSDFSIEVRNVPKNEESSYQLNYEFGYPVQPHSNEVSLYNPSVQFLPTTRMEMTQMTALWDEVQANDEDSQVLQTLRYIEPRVERLLARGEGEQRSFWVRLKGQKELVRLSSVGDGMRHLLALALNVAMSANRYLLIDEIDLGLHHSVMAKMWRMLIASAKRLNIQVFATTHSIDCINALAEVQKELNLTPEDLMLHRLEADLQQTISYTPEEIVDAAKYDAEVR